MIQKLSAEPKILTTPMIVNGTCAVSDSSGSDETFGAEWCFGAVAIVIVLDSVLGFLMCNFGNHCDDFIFTPGCILSA